MAETTPRRTRGASSTRSVTMLEVGQAAGVSAQTVSRVLSSPDRVSLATRERVHRAIEETGYVPNLAASHLASNRSRSIAAIVPVISSSVFSDTLRAAADRLSPAGYQITVGYTDYQEEREEDLIRGAISRRPDGFLIVGTLHTEQTTRLLRAYGAPVVETWDWNTDPLDTLVGFSNRDALIDVVRYLVDKGHRRLTFAGVIRRGDSRAIRRLEGFSAGVRALLPDEPLRIVDLPGRDVSMDTGVDLLDTALERHPETTALVFPSDVFAAAAVLAAQRRGVSVPDDLAITGFGDFEMARHLIPALTTVNVDVDEIGTKAADLLLARIEGNHVPAPTVDVGYRIVARGTA
ncbi:LacI family DNA-binding transcriptional regulator [Mycolicibacterium sp. 22603]|uniref:LacI family DNA-binding transcriptional regulator n=1 Tax=Mycolicibacterium sp. 22603 TaxID=3453950 RepID=UPI003F85A48D